MYVRHFGLAMRPFGLPPDPNFVHDSGVFGRSFRAIRDSIESGQRLHLLLGRAGTGKTTLLMKLDAELDYPGTRVLVPYGHFSFEQIVHYVLARLEPSPTGYGDGQESETLELALHRLESRLEPVVIMLDEGQNLTRETLYSVLRFVEREESDLGPGQVVLAGTEELQSLLESCSGGDTEAATTATHWLGALGEQEVFDYVNHRLSLVAEHDRTLFDQQALERVARLSQGVPRIINLICDRALLMAFGDKHNTVTEESVARAAHDLELQPELEELALISAQIRADLDTTDACAATADRPLVDDDLHVHSVEDGEALSPASTESVPSRWSWAVDVVVPGLREAWAECKRLVQRAGAKLRARVVFFRNDSSEDGTREVDAPAETSTVSAPGAEIGPVKSSRLPELVHSWQSGNWRPRREHVLAAWAGLGTIGLVWVLTMASPESETTLRATQADLAAARATAIELNSRVSQLTTELGEARVEQEILHSISAGLQEDLLLASEVETTTLASQEPSSGQSAEIAEIDAEPSSDHPLAASPNPSSDRTYRVAKGDTLWSIARNHGVSVAQLNHWNRLLPETAIRVGQELRVEPNAKPHDGGGTRRAIEREDARYYTVKTGDSLYGIARQFNVSVAELQEWNRLNNGEVIVAEQQLIVLR